MAPEFVRCYAAYVHWLRSLLERLGREHAIRVWHDAFHPCTDALLEAILERGWDSLQDASAGADGDVDGQIDRALSDRFPLPVEGVSAVQARRLIEASTPIRQIRERFETLNLVRQATTYEWLHLFCGGRAALVESLIAHHGVQGELIAYDTMARLVARHPREEMPAQVFFERYKARPEGADRFTAGLECELVRVSKDEVAFNILECEWARYYRERHPRIGYLMACSLDEADYRTVHPTIRMQRTGTLMEGAPCCDFRLYALDESLIR
jgi:hypothetical protein